MRSNEKSKLESRFSTIQMSIEISTNVLTGSQKHASEFIVHANDSRKQIQYASHRLRFTG